MGDFSVFYFLGYYATIEKKNIFGLLRMFHLYLFNYTIEGDIYYIFNNNFKI